MTATTFTPQRSTVTADMLWTLTAQYPESEQRIWRGAEMVGLVERTATPGLFLVGSASDVDSAYQVDQCGCSCADFQGRGGFCKHMAARALFIASERADADATDPTLTVRVASDESILDLWPAGEPCDLPAQCPRCHAEETNRRHPDGLGNACISRELFGEEV